MESSEPSPLTDKQSVFLNVPFDPEYNSLFIALIAGAASESARARGLIQ
jgi:hypothetical protein